MEIEDIENVGVSQKSRIQIVRKSSAASIEKTSAGLVKVSRTNADSTISIKRRASDSSLPSIFDLIESKEEFKEARFNFALIK